MTVDVIQRGEALAVFERDLIIHFQQISRAAALYVRALLGGVKRALEVYRRVDDTTKNYPWSTVTTEEKWHSHAEGALMVALTSLNLPAEAWKSARILRAIPKLIQYATVAGHFPSATVASVKAKPKKANKVDVPTEETKGETQANATGPITPRPKPKAQPKNATQPTPPKMEPKPPEQNKGSKGAGKGVKDRWLSDRPQSRVEQGQF